MPELNIELLKEIFSTLPRILFAVAVLIPWLYLSVKGLEDSGEAFDAKYLMEWFYGAFPSLLPLMAIPDSLPWYAALIVGLIWGIFTKGGAKQFRKSTEAAKPKPDANTEKGQAEIVKQVQREARKTFKKLGVDIAESVLEITIGGIVKKAKL